MHRRRRKDGQAIAEMGPAMLIILCVVFFPMTVILYIGLGWACGWYLNQMCCAAAAVAGDANQDGTVSQAEMDTAMQPRVDEWQRSGLAKFTRASVDSNVATRLNTRVNQPIDVDDFVVVVTTVTVTPFVEVPILHIGPVQFNFRAERPVEDTGQF